MPTWVLLRWQSATASGQERTYSLDDVANELGLDRTLRLSETAKRQLKKLDAGSAQTILRYLNRLVLETSNPRERGRGLQANLAGLWRYRVGDYCLISSLEDHELVVLVLQIAHRCDVYK